MREHALFSNIDFLETDCSAEEKETLDFIETVIQKNSFDTSEKIEEKLINFPYLILLKFCYNSPILITHCKNNIIFQTLLAEKLKQHNYIEFSYESMDKNLQIIPFYTYIAASYFNTYLTELPKARLVNESKILCVKALNNACQLGLYQALIHRCKFNLKKITTESPHALSNNLHLNEIRNDLDRLSNLFWSVGFFQAGCVLENLSEIAKAKGEETFATQLRYDAIKKFICALLLEEHNHSKKILNALTQDQGLSFLFMQMNFPIATKEEAFSSFEQWLEPGIFQEIFDSTKNEIQKYL